MYYFIPAWYNPWRSWYDITQPWYRGGGLHGFDDTINQLRMFEYAGKKNRLMVLNYMPQLRYIAHQYDLFEVDTWSLFDDVQNIQLHQFGRIDFKDLNWPAGAEFIFTPFLVVVRRHKKTIAIVEFGSDGQLIWIDYFSDDVQCYRYVFDDRGFVSSIIYYENGKEHYQDYLNPAGQWQIREYLLPEDKHVEIAPSEAHRFAQNRYSSMGELVREKVIAYFANLDEEVVLLVASHAQNNELLATIKGQHQLVLSYYQERFDVTQREQVERDLLISDLVVADNLALTSQLNQFGLTEVEHLSPFDTRLSLGKSQRLKELDIYFLIDGLTDDEVREYLEDVFIAMEQNDHITLSLVTYEKEHYRRQIREAFLEAILEEENRPYLYFEDEEKTTMFEVVGEEEEVASRVSYAFHDSELAIQKALEFTRLIVDLSEYPDLYTQIAGISAGIPQVNKKQSEFVEHLKNGYLMTEEDNLFFALDYYLTGLANWNKSLVYAVQKIEDYTSGRLVSRLLDKMRRYE